MKVNDFKRLAEEDFPQESREVVRKIAFAVNPYLEQIKTALDKNIDFDNLNQALITFKVQVDASGIPKGLLQVKSPLKTNIQGIQVIRADNLTDSVFLTGSPFITFSRNQGTLTIQHITGLAANKDYNITVILIG